MDILVVVLIKATVFFLNLLPLGWRLTILHAVIRGISFFTPKLKQVAQINLQIAFPEKSASEHERIMRASEQSFARVLVDIARLKLIDLQWVREHVDLSELADLDRYKLEYPGKGMILVAGHLGSFELLGGLIALTGYPAHVIYRELKGRRLDAFVRDLRERKGNKGLERTGAVRGMLRALNNGENVGILFDQNVKRAQAIFVPWFGKLAATTGAVALAAYRLKAPVTVLALVHHGSDRYKYIVRPIDLKTIYESDLDKEQAHKKITEIVSNCYVELIRQYPEQWFWMHRRWRTRPEGEKIIY